jgi:hypothetical protein
MCGSFMRMVVTWVMVTQADIGGNVHGVFIVWSVLRYPSISKLLLFITRTAYISWLKWPVMFELHNVHSYMLILIVFGYSFPELFYIEHLMISDQVLSLVFMLPQNLFWEEHIVAASCVRPCFDVSVRAQFLSGLFLSNLWMEFNETLWELHYQEEMCI